MKTHIRSADSEGISEAARLLKAGEPVAVPTETVYGLAADALSATACARIFEAKGRPLYDPLIVHVPSSDWLDRLAAPSDLGRRLAAAFWPGPLTIVLPRREIVPDIVTSGQDTVALRMSAHPAMAAILAEFGGPVGAPSANRFGRISPTTARHVESELGGLIPLIVDGGPCSHGVESTIVYVGEDWLEILRPGPITGEMLEKFAPIRVRDRSDIAVPGGLKSHYAPGTPLVLGYEKPEGRAGLLAWGGSGEGFEVVERLSARGDLREAAANLYGSMRRLDEAGLDILVAEPVPEIGLGVAIMERLRKAAARG